MNTFEYKVAQAANERLLAENKITLLEYRIRMAALNNVYYAMPKGK